MSVVLGLNAFHAGASAALIIDGRPVAAMAEERLCRVKHYAGFPRNAIRLCLQIAGLDLDEVDAVAVGRDTSANLGRKVAFALRQPTRLLKLVRSRRARSGLDDLRSLIASECEVDPARLRFREHYVEHHVAHVASAYLAGDQERAAGFSIDGSGDFVTCLMARCEGDRIEPVRRIYVPNSLGSFYTMVCQFIGYGRYGDEGKVMGLAPYGTDSYAAEFAEMVSGNGGIRLNPRWFVPFGEDQGLRIDEGGEMQIGPHYSDLMVQRFGPPRPVGGDLGARERDLAFGVQKRFEEIYLQLLRQLHREVPEDSVAIAGGCALNSVANGMIYDRTPFGHTSIQPAAGDEGLALGAALYVSRSLLGEGERWMMRDAYLGPSFAEPEMRSALESRRVAYVQMEPGALLDAVADELAEGRVVGWFQGRMEWGPRALGNRSILAHPGLPGMKAILNERVKGREEFRPFAPSVLADRQGEIFEESRPSPFMLHVHPIRAEWRERLPAVTHVDGTGRLQSVTTEENPLYYDLIRRFERRTGLPVLLNTSFNENEPIVCAPEEAVDCYLRTRMDILAMGPFLCRKQPTA